MKTEQKTARRKGRIGLVGCLGLTASVSRKATPLYNTPYNNFILFIPYSQLDIREPGKHNLKFCVELFDLSGASPKKLDKTEFIHFDYIK